MPKEVILLVDDYPAGRTVGTMMLEHLGYAVKTACSGMEAIEKVRLSTKPFLAILMDIKMPDMDGFETTKIIRQIEHEKGFYHTIIAVTAHALAGDKQRCLDAGMNDYISKPINLEILKNKLAAQARSVA